MPFIFLTSLLGFFILGELVVRRNGRYGGNDVLENLKEKMLFLTFDVRSPLNSYKEKSTIFKNTKRGIERAVGSIIKRAEKKIGYYFLSNLPIREGVGT